jgi:hypothetical protein
VSYVGLRVHSDSEHNRLINLNLTSVVDTHTQTEIVSIPAWHTQKLSASCLCFICVYHLVTTPNKPPPVLFFQLFSCIVGISLSEHAKAAGDLESHDCRYP